MNKRTPGPWFTDQYGHVYGWSAPEGSKESVLLIDNRHSNATRADKNLIAAAPELLDALESFPGFLADTSNGDEWIEKMRSAIAKARGES